MSRAKNLVFSLLSLLLAPHLPGQNVQLADGRILLATVEEADGDGLRVKRLDNGGALDLRWEQLSTASATAIKRRFDLAGDPQTEVLMRADEIEYTFNGTKKTIVGRIVERTADTLIVQQRGMQFPIRIADLSGGGVRKVEVPVTEVLTKDEYYAQRLLEQPPGEEADRHVLLAEELIRVRDYAHATEHLQKAKELGNSRNPQQIDALITKLERFKAAEKELTLLEQIQAATSRGKPADFVRGTQLIAQFEKDFPQTKLKNEFDAAKKRFHDTRKKELSQLIATELRRAIGPVAEKKVEEENFTLDAARDYAQTKMAEDLFARVGTLVKLPPAEVKELWAARVNYSIGKRPDHFDYGLGSWVLGEAGVIKDAETKAGAEKDKEPSTTDREADRARKIVMEAYRQRMRNLQGMAGGGEEEETEEQWWARAGRAERTAWLRAYFAEFSGQMVVRSASVTPCPSCYGAGTTIAYDGDKPVHSKCGVCHQTKKLRSLKAY